MRFFDILTSTGPNSTASKILYLTCDIAGEQTRSAIHKSFDVQNYNESVRNFKKLRDLLAKIISEHIDYEAYCKCDETCKETIRNIIAIKLASIANAHEAIKFPYALEKFDISYKPVEFAPEYFENEEFLSSALLPAFVFIKDIIDSPLLTLPASLSDSSLDVLKDTECESCTQFYTDLLKDQETARKNNLNERDHRGFIKLEELDSYVIPQPNLLAAPLKNS